MTALAISEAFEHREMAVLVALGLQDAYNMRSLLKLAHRFNVYLQPKASIITPHNAIIMCYVDITIIARHRDTAKAINTTKEVVNSVRLHADIST